jgi:hypothetical protein
VAAAAGALFSFSDAIQTSAGATHVFGSAV